MATWPSPPATRILSWSQMVREADPNYTRLSLQPWVYSFSNSRLFVDLLPLYDFGSFGELSDISNVLNITANPNWPTSPVGLAEGDVWDNGGIVNVIRGVTPGQAPPLLLSETNGFALLETGGANLPVSSVGLLAGQLWNNKGVVNVWP